MTIDFSGATRAKLPPKKPRKPRKVKCDQCVIAVINGVVCHEHGCPNARKGK